MAPLDDPSSHVKYEGRHGDTAIGPYMKKDKPERR